MLAIIGGTGVDLRGVDSPLHSARDEKIYTRWGSAHLTRGQLRGDDGSEREIVFLHRHADAEAFGARSVPPHAINYRANIAALKVLGVTGILASTAVGTMNPELPPGTLALLSDFIDHSSNRAITFYDERAIHIDMSAPYCERMRGLLLETAAQLQIPLRDNAVYLCANGPRFETPAEIRAFRMWGADVVGMTGCPEATLAREANLAYAGVSIATNWASGITNQPLTHTEVVDAMHLALPNVSRLFLEVARAYEDDPTAPSRTATREFATPDYDPAEIFGA